jgi:citrate lyase alpha subunit
MELEGLNNGVTVSNHHHSSSHLMMMMMMMMMRRRRRRSNLRVALHDYINAMVPLSMKR